MAAPAPARIRQRGRLLLAVACLALTALATDPAAAAGAAHTAPARALALATHRPPRPVPTALARKIGTAGAADLAAAKRARATGKPVLVSSRTTATSQTVARPDGSFATTTYVLPVRVKVHGVWRSVSMRLRRVPGGWSPAVAPSGVAFSHGGSRPMAVLTSIAGARLAIRFPSRLPAPVISGATATYRSVVPGADLLLTATDPGGITVTLVVRDARAAASPLIRRLRLGFATRDLGARSTGSGTVAFADPAGVTEYTAPSAVMWDSRHAGAGRAGPGSSTAAFPGRGARTAPVRAALARSGVTLAPDPALLSARTRYPVYISAAVTARQLIVTRARPRSGVMTPAGTFNNTVKSAQQYFGEVKSACPGTAGLQGSSWQGVGYQDYNPDCNGQYSKYRAIYRFDTSGLDNGMVIEKATLEAWVQYGADFGCNDTWPITAHWVTKIDSSTTWNSLSTHNNDPAVELDVKPGPNPNSTCSVQSPTFTITDAVATAAHNGYTDMSWSFWGDECTSSCSPTNYGYMGIGDNPNIQTVYDRVPPVPVYPGCTSAGECSKTCTSSTNCAESPSPQDHPGGAWDDGCNTSGTYGWIDQSSAWLQVDIASAIANEDVRGHFSMTDDKNGGSSVTIGQSFNGSYGWTESYTGGVETFTPVDNALKDGHSYSWQVYDWVNGDGTDLNSGYNNANAANVSAWTSPTCHFNVDLTAPAPPSVTSTTFPPTGGTTTNGNPGTFSFSSTDPVPTGCNPSPCLASGVYGYIYSLNGGTPVTTTAGSATLTIGDWGTNVLQVQAQDNAGNISRPSYYTFYVPWNSGIQPIPGDVTGDGKPDLLATTTGGGLNLYPGNITTALPAAVNASGPGLSPDSGTDWNTFDITHRGSVTQQGSYDDLWALGGSHSTLYLYQNNPPSHGAAPQYGNTAWVNPVTYPTCNATADNTGNCGNYPTGWSAYSQILSPGDAWTGDPSGGGSIIQDSGIPSLLAVDSGGRLWLFQGQFGNALANPIQLGTGWSGMTLIAPGQINGQLELWARNNSTGALNSYVISIDGNKLPTLSAATLIPGITLTQAAYPAIASVGDNSTGTAPALVAVDSSGNVWEYPGTTGTTTGSTPPPPLGTTPTKIGTVPAGSITQLS